MPVPENVNNEKILKLKKFNTYESLLVDFDRLIRMIMDENINVLNYRNHLKQLVNLIIKEVTDHEFYFTNLLSCVENPHRFVSHSVNTAILSYILSSSLNVDSLMVPKLIQAALLHDVGKLNFNDKIKELYIFHDDDPNKIAQSHSIWGERILLYHLKTDPDIAKLVLNHHEQNDGSGFPRSLKGSDLSVYDQIISSANLIDNIIQKANFPCFESLGKNIEVLLSGYGQKFAPFIQAALRDIFSLKNEGRKNRRFRMAVKGRIESETANIATACEILNISSFGAEVSSPIVLNPGMDFKMNARITNGFSLKDKTCKVMWTGLSEGKFVYGLKFDIPNESLTALLMNIE